MRIEKKIYDKLPESYKAIIKSSSTINASIDVRIERIKFLKSEIINIDSELSSLIDQRDSLNNKILFIERNYIPKIYFKTYFKKKNPNIFSHVVIKYLNKSKTVYFGKIDDLIIYFLTFFPSLNRSNFKKEIIPILSSLIIDDLFDINTESEFVGKIYNSVYFKTLISNYFNSNFSLKENEISFSDYLKSLK